MPNKKNDIYCSFCGKHVDHVKKMIEGPGPDHAYICNECIRLTNDILDEDPDYEDDEYKSGNWNPRKFMKPKEIKAALEKSRPRHRKRILQNVRKNRTAGKRSRSSRKEVGC